MRRYNRRTIKKLKEGRCFFCAESDLKLLDNHRIVPGSQGGKYHWLNILVVCAKCHRKIHCGRIWVDRKYHSTAGMIVHFWEDGEEHWRPESRPHFVCTPDRAGDEWAAC